MTPIRVLLVDDADVVRRSFRALLRSDPRFQVVGEAADGAGAEREAERTRPDVVLMDVQMPGVDGLAATARLRERPHPFRVLVVSTFGLDEYVRTALANGASGFLLKNAPPDEILRGIVAVHEGHAVLAPEVTAMLLPELAPVPTAPGTGHPFTRAHLSAREVEVVRLVAEGLSNAQIAAALHVSPETVKTYLTRIFGKLGVRDRTHLAVGAAEAGLLRRPR